MFTFVTEYYYKRVVTMKYTSKHIENAVEALSELPSIGKKSALRLVLYLLGQNNSKAIRIAQAIDSLHKDVKSCTKCHAYSDFDICYICGDRQRDDSILCIVESIRDLMAIEETGQFRGKYHVLGGVISPLDGKGPNDIQIASLIQRLEGGDVTEIIMAIPSTIEGETTIYYIANLLKERDVRVSVISRGVSFAGDLEYADEITLGRSITSRIPYHQLGASAY
jgi:recombination protein RecR